MKIYTVTEIIEGGGLTASEAASPWGMVFDNPQEAVKQIHDGLDEEAIEECGTPLDELNEIFEDVDFNRHIIKIEIPNLATYIVYACELYQPEV